MKSQNDVEIEILYAGKPNKELNAKLDGAAETNGGKFATFSETKSKNFCTRTYLFVDDGFLDEFFEQANFIISRHFSFEVNELEDLASNLRWDFNEAVYHHVEFEELKDALNFAIGLRAIFSTYTHEDMFDVKVFKDSSSGENSFFVVYAFPVDSLISVVSSDDDYDGEKDLFSSVLGPKDKSKLN